MDNYILTYFHHGGNVVAGPKLIYKGEVDVFVVAIDKDHYSLFEFLSYAKDFGYSNIEGFCCQHTYGEDLVPINSDWELLDFVKDLKNGDELDVFPLHGIDEDIEVVSKSSLLLEGPPTCIDEDDIGSNGNEGKGLDEDLNGIESDVPSTDSDIEIPDADGSDIDEELRAFRAENRSKINPIKKAKEEIPVGEACIDKGFQDIFRKKKDRYVGRLGSDEEFIDSSDCDSIDNTDLVDEDAVVGADLPRRRRSSKIRFDGDCGVVVFELGMIFNGPKEFRKALGRYAVQNRVQIVLRPNEIHRVRAKCKFKPKCSWLCYGEIDRDSCNFMIKNYNPVYKCKTSNKNKMCTTKFVADRFRDDIIKQPSLRIWEIQELCREKLGLYVARTIYYKARLQYLKEDLQLGTGAGLTVMADMQKGFLAAVFDLLPNTKVRRCARHIWSNWSQQWKGKERRKQFWKYSKANFEVKFKEELDYMSQLGIQIARHKSIITMLEDIRRKIMIRTVDMIKFANTWICDIAPMARLLLEENKERARACKEPEPYVEHWYKKETFMKAYSYFIQPISNIKIWPETNNPKIEPPEPKKMPGRPARNRRRGKGELKKKYEKLSKQRVKITCSKCHQQGHNRRYCKGFNKQFTAVHGLHIIIDRKEMWRDIEVLSTGIQSPWIIMSDFNAILNHDDRLGSQVQEVEVRYFNALLTNTGVTILRTVGRFYTYTNSHVHSRIDRALSYPAWLSMWPHFEVEAKDLQFSDHALMCVAITYPPDRHARPFRFLTHLCNHA
ncbi:hypothetical protein BC332_14059 [Capsicum chinense]|nr:hypothetical protein BC332_14059 [Capsicum chinense]